MLGSTGLGFLAFFLLINSTTYKQSNSNGTNHLKKKTRTHTHAFETHVESSAVELKLVSNSYEGIEFVIDVSWPRHFLKLSPPGFGPN